MGAKHILAMLGSALLFMASGSMAQAASCYDLWYERNLIYAENGYCFSTSLGKRVFAGFNCWTKNPALSEWEKRRVAQLRSEEKRRGCKVNK